MKSSHPVKMKMVVTAIITLLLTSIAFSASAAVYTYDSLNRLTSVTYKNGQKIVYTYDPGGNMLSVDSHDADTPPTVKTTDPTDGAIDVSVSASVYVTFSESVVEDVYFSDINIKNTVDSSVVDCTYSLSGDLLTIDPFNDLNYSVTYAVYIPAGAVKDNSGNSLASTYSFSFTTGSTLDTTPPTVTSTDPSNGETGVPIDKVITVDFSEGVQEGEYFNEIGLSLGEDMVSSTISVNGNSLTIYPDASLGFSTNYYVMVPYGSVRDGAGNNLVCGYFFSFTTGDTAPIINSTDPANGASDVEINKIITVAFSEPVIQGTNFYDISITDSYGTVYYGDASVSESTLTIVPTSNLDYNTTYNVIIPAGAVEDYAYNPLASAYSFSFTTATDPNP